MASSLENVLQGRVRLRGPDPVCRLVEDLVERPAKKMFGTSIPVPHAATAVDSENGVGRVVEETEEFVAFETKDPETGEQVVFELLPEEVTARRRDVSAMPGDLVQHLSRRQLRDLVAFLASLRE